MTIATKKGDRGNTSLLCGKRVAKDDALIEICGTLDELTSFLGFAKSLLKNRRMRKIIDRIQRELLIIGSEIAGGASSRSLKKRITSREIDGIELFVEEFEKNYPLKKRSFVIPGTNILSATLDVARAIARRVERRAVSLKKKRRMRNDAVVVYLNRLSDLLFLMARYCEKRR